MKKLIKVALFLLATSCYVQAQKPQNLILNPGFETFEKGSDGQPDYKQPFPWKVDPKLNSSTTSYVVTDKPHSGTYALQLYPGIGGAGYLGMWDKDWNFTYKFDATEGEWFTLTYWYRGTYTKPALRVEIRLYSSPASGSVVYDNIGEYAVEGSEVVASGEWKMQTVAINISKTLAKQQQNGEVKSFDLLFLMPKNASNADEGFIVLDDFSLTKGKPAPPVVIEVPKQLTLVSYQRELEISWSGNQDREVTWDLMINDKEIKGLKQNSYLLTNQTPGSKYDVKVRATKGDKHSQYSEVKSATLATPIYSQADDMRIPYLRNLRGKNIAPRKFRPFFNELYGQQVSFTYKIDGVAVIPDSNGFITFPSTGKHQLSIVVNEGSNDAVWNLDYMLDIVEK